MRTAEDYSALKWIKDELDETIRQARKALEEYVEGSGEAALLETCNDRLHEIHGTLQMVQLYGAAMLAEEMEEVSRAILSNQVRVKSEATEALMLSLVQLPDYLEKLQDGGRDIPLVILPLLNDLRATRDAPLLTEASLFTPELDQGVVPEQVTGVANAELPELARRLRVNYHRGLIGWYRNIDPEVALGRIDGVMAELEQHAHTATVYHLFWVGHALVAGLLENAISPGSAVKSLFGRLDREIKRIVDGGEEEISRDPPSGLLKNMLYYVARARSDNAGVKAVQNAYRLEAALPSETEVAAGRARLTAPSADAIDTVRDVIKSGLIQIKDNLDLYIRGDHSRVASLCALEEPLRKLGDTLGMVGQGALRVRLNRQADRLAGFGQAGSPPEETELMKVAGEILFVESSLANVGMSAGEEAGPAAEVSGAEAGALLLPQGELGNLIDAALHEAHIDMARAKEAIVAFIESPVDSDGLMAVPGKFRNVAGALRILSLNEAADLLDAIAGYVQTEIAEPARLPERVQLNALADAITSVEYYMESVLEGHRNRDDILDIARTALGKLGLEVIFEKTVPQPQGAPGESEPAFDTGPEVQGQQVVVSDAHPESPASADKPALEEIDPEILEVFVDEAREELDVIREFYVHWKQNPQDKDALTRFRRSFHTLKGSGRLVGAKTIGELAWSIENMLNRLIDETIEVNPEILDILDQTVEALPRLIEQHTGAGVEVMGVRALMERAVAAINPAPEAAEEDAGRAAGSLPQAGTGAEPERGAAVPEVALAAETDAAPASEPKLSVEPVPDYVMEPELLEIFGEEARTYLEFLQEFIGSCRERKGAVHLTEGVYRALHTLHGSANMAEVDAIADVSKVLEKLVEGLRERDESADATVVDALDEGVAIIRAQLAAINASGTEFADVGPFIDRVNALREQGVSGTSGATAPELSPPEQPATESEPPQVVEEDLISGGAAPGLQVQEETDEGRTPAEDGYVEVGGDPELAEIFLEEARELLDNLDAALGQWRQNPRNRAAVANLQRTLHTLKGGARMAGIAPMGDLAHAFESLLSGIGDGEVESGEELFPFAQRVADRLSAQVDEINDSGRVRPAGDLIEQMHELLAGEPQAASASEITEKPPAVEEPEVEEWPEVEVDLPPDAFESPEAIAAPELERQAEETETVASAMEEADSIEVDGDEELVGIFLEEARELLDNLDATLSHWREAPEDKAAIAELQRTLHTLKGGARLAGITPVGDLGHALESLLTGVTNDQVGASDQVQALVQQVADRLASQVHEVAEADRVPLAQDLIAQMQALLAGEALPEPESRETASRAEVPESAETAQTGVNTVAEAESAEVVNLFAREEDKARIASAPADRASPLKTVTREAPPARPKLPLKREQVRVRSDVLDRLVNNAGEVSIYRARLEQQNSAIGFNLSELEQTVARLRQQLRQLEMETEAQILFRYEREQDESGGAEEEFDPLELDRFSTMQQLSRSLMETVNDLVSIKDLSEDLQRDMETLLMQQSRVSTDLQDGLLRTRMVPFTQVVSRLQRVVRQTCRSVNKQAEFRVDGARVEVDRSILERMVAPLEHILRNAVSHGIELPDRRLERGKSAQGLITLNLSREGTDVVLAVADNGAGLKLDNIRRRAIEKGLLAEGADVADNDVMQFILEPGFSTADEVSQIAGRGVGMDVVVSEVKQLGGSLEIESQYGSGTCFTVRLPLTLAISEALLVQMGEDVYAVPHSSIEGVVRISRQELEDCYEGRQEGFAYAGHTYLLRYLGSMLGVGAISLPEGKKWFPMLLVRSGDRRVAVQVDGLLGNRQIVVKSVGPQLSTVRWITGGTILGDGRVALILDVNAMVRMDAVKPLSATDKDTRLSIGTAQVKVMVVDDSITVRKVTGRLLERYNFKVTTAKDGVDAVALLQDYTPDLMLLDIEMPRMDGFELARHMRNSADLKAIPIIMITSRTGDKHHRLAMELGVKGYLGKPYQEMELLDNIYSTLAEAQA